MGLNNVLLNGYCPWVLPHLHIWVDKPNFIRDSQSVFRDSKSSAIVIVSVAKDINKTKDAGFEDLFIAP
jgi:hypothetical protein